MNWLVKNKFLKTRELNIAKRSDLYLLLILAVLGCAATLYFRANLRALPYQFGFDSIGLFIPPFLTGIYLIMERNKRRLTNATLGKAVLLFIIQLIPLIDLLFVVVLPNPGEDFARNLVYAKNMIANQTLWGGDKIIYPDEGNAFITQPGYRYFIALEMFLFGNVYRFVSVLNILLFIISLFFFMQTLVASVENKIMRQVLLVFVVLTIPYATKNILMGLSEWLMVAFLMLSVYFYKVRRLIAVSILLLALVPFVRQNTLPPVVLLAGWMIFNNRDKLVLAILFLGILLLPVYHNLYFAGQWRFFVSVYHWPFMSYESPSKYVQPSGFNFPHVSSNILHYFGIHIRGNGSIDFLEEACMFLLPFIFIYYHIQKKYFSGYMRLFYLMVTLGVILPTIFFATDFYPRFEFVCVYFAIAVFFFLYPRNNHTSVNLNLK